MKFVIPAPEPPKPKPAPAGETYLESLRRRALEEVANGRAVNMNDLLRSVPEPKFPKPRGWSTDKGEPTPPDRSRWYHALADAGSDLASLQCALVRSLAASEHDPALPNLAQSKHWRQHDLFHWFQDDVTLGRAQLAPDAVSLEV